MRIASQKDRFMLRLDSIGDDRWNALVAAARTGPDSRDRSMSRLIAALPPSAAPLVSEFDNAWAQETIARETAAFELGAGDKQ